MKRAGSPEAEWHKLPNNIVSTCLNVPGNLILGISPHFVDVKPNCVIHVAAFNMLMVAGSVLLALVNAEIEHSEHGHTHTPHNMDGEHNVEFDHEAILGKTTTIETFLGQIGSYCNF